MSKKATRPNLFPKTLARVPPPAVLPAKTPDVMVDTGPPPFPYIVADFFPIGRLLVLFGDFFPDEELLEPDLPPLFFPPPLRRARVLVMPGT